MARRQSTWKSNLATAVNRILKVKNAIFKLIDTSLIGKKSSTKKRSKTATEHHLVWKTKHVPKIKGRHSMACLTFFQIRKVNEEEGDAISPENRFLAEAENKTSLARELRRKEQKQLWSSLEFAFLPLFADQHLLWDVKMLVILKMTLSPLAALTTWPLVSRFFYNRGSFSIILGPCRSRYQPASSPASV